MRPLAVTVATAVALSTFAGCSSDDDPGGDAAPSRRQAQVTYVAVGASETVGVGAADPRRDAWTAVLHRTAFPDGTRFVNTGVSGSTIEQALERQLPRALEARADVATVWLNVNDILRLVDARTYEERLGRLVRALRAGGRTEVLVANTPPIEDLPVVRACLPDPPPGRRCPLPIRLPDASLVTTIVDAYNDAISRVAEREGAIVVDLQAAGATARRDGGIDALVSGDGFHPSTEGHRGIARVFAHALARSPQTRELVVTTAR